MFQRFFYVSRAAEPVREQDLLTIYEQSIPFNNAHGVTGMLVYENRHFLQFIEASPEVMPGLHDRIQRDPRHSLLRTFSYTVVRERVFREWRMLWTLADGSQFALPDSLARGSASALSLPPQLIASPQVAERLVTNAYLGVQEP